MRVYFDHIEGWGKVSDLDLVHGEPWGELSEGETPRQALEAGWIPWQGRWYNQRSVRIDTARYQPARTTRRLSKRVEIALATLGSSPRHRDLYRTYCHHHGFKRVIDLDEFAGLPLVEYHYQDRLVGYSLYDTPGGSDWVTYQFVWDYASPELSLGKIAQLWECQLAQAQGYPYVYILGGYEQTCLYKADFHGMEWWTGSVWSRDTELYRQLCRRDSLIHISHDHL